MKNAPKIRFSFSVVLAFLCFGSLLAQQNRPVVGLVLSGGGAKGVAHIGLLKMIDSLQIPIDYVAGTSMGSVIGGMYAVGYSPEQIREEVMAADWGELLSDRPKRKYLSYAEKDNKDRYLVTTSLEGYKVHVPSGFVKGQNLEAKLNEIFIGYHDPMDYMDLPRGFVCVAADLNNAEEHTMSRGVLPRSIRASISIPSMFDPVRVDGRLLVDGGTMNNFPADKLKELGCDIIIGMELQSLDPDTSSNPSIAQILEHTSMFINDASADKRRALCDLIVRPDMKQWGMTDFGEVLPIYDEGLSTAREAVPELVKIKKRIGGEPARLLTFDQPDSVFIRSVNIGKLERISDQLVDGHFDVEGGRYYKIEFLEEELKQLHGTDNFQKVLYRLKKTGEPNHYDLELNVKETRTNTDIGIGVKADGDFGAQALLNVTNRSFLLEGSKTGIDIIVRRHPYVKLFYYYDRGVKPGFGFYSKLYTQAPDLYFEDTYRGQVSFEDWSNALYFQSTYKNLGSVQAGVQFDLQSYYFGKVPEWTTLDRPDSTDLGLMHLNWYVDVGIDKRNRSNFATHGAFFNARLTIHELVSETFDVFDFNQFIILKAEYKQPFQVGDRWVLEPQVYGGVTFNENSTYPYKFYLGSMGEKYLNNNHAFPGYRFMGMNFVEAVPNQFDEGQYIFYAQNLGTFRLDVRWNFWRKHYLIATGAVGTASHLLENFLQSHHFGGFALKYAIDSGFGPLEIVAHKSTERGTVFVYFNLGYWF